MKLGYRIVLSILGLGIVLASAWWAYHPGLRGGFLFDDYANLPALGASGPVHTWPIFWRYITSGNADPTGRPLALLSFLLDARNWPANPRSFLCTNLVLHLINGVLLAMLLRCLGQALTGKSAAPNLAEWRINLAALLGAAFWLLHPLFVSTTLYIVQREAMLPATFTLLGLLLWLHGRTHLLAGHRERGWIWMLLGLGGCTILGVLSKANGILLPALALTIECTVLRAFASPLELERTNIRRTYRHTLWVLGWLPACIVTLYLIYVGWNGIIHGITSIRSWTLGQRLLTEPRVLMDYLGLLWLPRPFTPGLFNDSIHVSTSLLTPATTLPSMLAVLGLIVAGLFLRKRWPVAAMAVLFYFVGQALESSTIPLELYYEHRNYLPAMLMFWPLALWLCGMPLSPTSKKNTLRRDQDRANFWPTTKLVLAVAMIASLALMTHARTEVWGNQGDQARLWARLNPHSPRAQAYAAQADMQDGHPQLAVARLRPALAAEPAQPQLALNLFAAECQSGHVDKATINASVLALRTTRVLGALLIHWYQRAIAQTDDPPCPQLTFRTLQQLLTAVQSNPVLMNFEGPRQDVWYLHGRIALKRKRAGVALTDFNHALEQQPRYGVALKQAALLGAAGFPRRGLAHLRYFQTLRNQVEKPPFGMGRIHAWVLRHQHYWRHELNRLRKTLESDAAAKVRKTKPKALPAADMRPGKHVLQEAEAPPNLRG